jgi:hypothetical protein
MENCPFIDEIYRLFSHDLPRKRMTISIAILVSQRGRGHPPHPKQQFSFWL